MLPHLELASQLHSRTKSLLPTGFELQILSTFTTEKHMVTFPEIGRFTSHIPLNFHSMRLTKTRLQYAIYNLITQLDLGLQKIAADLFFAVALSAEKFYYKQGLHIHYPRV